MYVDIQIGHIQQSNKHGGDEAPAQPAREAGDQRQYMIYDI